MNTIGTSTGATDSGSTSEGQGQEFSRHRQKDILECPLGPASLCGSWFHRLRDDEIEAQGVVVGEPQAGVYLLEFKWADGAHWQGLESIKRMIETEDVEWRFYDSEEWMRSAYANHLSQKGVT